jgi:hypothetical protein
LYNDNSPFSIPWPQALVKLLPLALGERKMAKNNASVLSTLGVYHHHHILQERAASCSLTL